MNKRTELKDALFARLIDIVQNGLEVMTEGSLVRVPAPAPYLQAAIALLKIEETAEELPVPKTTSDVLNRLHKARPGLTVVQ